MYQKENYFPTGFKTWYLRYSKHEMIFEIVNDGLMMHQIMIIIWMLLLLLVIKKVTNKPTEGEMFIKSHKFAFSGPLASFQDFSCLFCLTRS